MNVDANLEAHLAALVFLVLLVVVAVELLIGVLLVLKGRRPLARKVFFGVIVACLVYVAVLLAFSLSSREKLLQMGQQKYICDLECHTAYSVIDVKQLKTLEMPPQPPVSARGTFYFIAVRSWFDPRTAAAGRPQTATARPTEREAVVIDAQGRRYLPSPDAARVMPAAELTRPLMPGESYATTLVFDLPVDVRAPRLLISKAGSTPIIGQETSWLHRKTYFLLQ